MNTRIRNPKSEIRNRGTLLAAYIILIPAALMLFLTILTRVEVLLGDAKRWQLRSQARLLAESALAVYEAARAEAAGAKGASPSIQGAIEGIGDYRIVETALDAGGRKIRAQGEIIDRRAPQPPCRVFSEIEAEVPLSPAGAALAPLRIIGVSYRIEPYPTEQP